MLTLLLFGVFAGVWKTAIALICGGATALGMALVKAPAGGVAASGKIGGTVFARNRAGNYARAWAKPINPSSPRQTTVRTAFAASSVAWGMLSQTQVDAWNSYAALLTRFNRLGEAYTPKGRQIYMETNANLAQLSLSPLHTPASATDSPSAFFHEPNVGSVTADASVVTNLTPAATGGVVLPGGGTGHFVIEATPPLDPKITNPQRYFRQVAIEDDSSLDTDIHARYNAVFGSIPAVTGMNVWLRIRLIDDVTGLSSPYSIGFKAIA